MADIGSASVSDRPQAPGELEHNAIGLSQTLFQAVTFMAPGVAITLSLQPSLPFAGVALPLSAIVGLLLMGTVAVSIGQLGKVYSSAGGLYAYISRAVGARFGFLVTWINFVFQTFIAIVIYLEFPIIYQAVLSEKLHYHLPYGWIMLFWALVVTVITIRGVKASTNVLVALGLFEILVFVVLSITLIVHAGSVNTVDAFNPSKATQGVSGIFKGGIFVILAFIGFESAAVLGEESREPRRIIPRAIVLATFAIGALYVLASYALVVGWGPNRLDTYSTAALPWLNMSTTVWGAGWILLFIALANSVFANCTAGINSSSRVYFAMGRTRTLLPRVMGKTQPRYKTPHIAIATNMVVGLIGAFIAALIWNPLIGFAVVATFFTILVVFIYMAATIACFYEYVIKRRSDMNPILHILFPAIGFAALGFTLYYLYHPLPPNPVRYALWAGPAVLLAGVVATFVLWRTNRRVVESSRDIVGVEQAARVGPTHEKVYD